jgi:hypothetical protein
MKTYKVVGTSTVVVNGSHAPGDVFTTVMDADTEVFLTQIGAIVTVAPEIPDAGISEPEPVVAPSRRLHRKKEE